MARTASQPRRQTISVEIEGHWLELSNLGKVLYPEAHFTKADVLDYYRKVSPALLPHLADRMLTLKRYPEGTAGQFFYEKRCPTYRPPWMKTKSVETESEKPLAYCQIDSLAAMVWVLNLASIEFHVLMSQGKAPSRPTAMVFDLDPGPPAGLVECCRAALKIRPLFDRWKLQCFAKTSGGKGLHLYVPLNTPVTFDETKGFSRAVAEFMQRNHPDEMTSQMKKTLRPGKVFIDWSQNDSHKTTVCVYSLRARARPTVSAPLSWKEVEACARSGNAAKYIFETEQVLKRLAKDGDLFAPVLTLKQQLPRRPVFP